MDKVYTLSRFDGKAIACVAMRKLIHLAFAILKSGQPFNPNSAV